MIDAITAKLLEPGTLFALVEGANELAEVDKRPPNTPAAYVYVAAEASAKNERINGVLQRSAVDIAVLVITENGAGPREAARDIETLKTFVRARLLGLVLSEDADPIEHIEGKIVSVKDGMVWFEDVFGTAHFLTEA